MLPGRLRLHVHLALWLLLIVGPALGLAACTASPSLPLPATVSPPVAPSSTAIPPSPTPPPSAPPPTGTATLTLIPSATLTPRATASPLPTGTPRPTETRPATATAPSRTTAPPPSPTPLPPTATLLPPTAAPAPRPTLPPVGLPPLTLREVFPPRNLASLGLDLARVRVLVATGDVIPARSVDTVIRQRGNDFLYTVSATQDMLRPGDLTVINLEAPLIQRCPPHNEGFVFCGQPGFTRALQAAGVDLATLENNHIGNYGEAGIEETKQRLTAAGIAWADRRVPAILDVRGLKFGFLAFNGVGLAFNREVMRERIQALRPQVDVLVVALHWGAEYVAVPSRAPGIAPDNPVDIAHWVIDSGADLILGNHPHWVQAVEVYQGKLIAYAHGNFIFDQMWSSETRVGVVGRYTFYDNQLVGVEYLPTLIENHSRPVPLGGKTGQEVLTRMEAASRELAAQLAR